jgi:hypothetical protein
MKMGIFKTKADRELEKKMLVRKTIASMNRQIAKLEEEKKVFIDKAKTAKRQGLESQYSLALSGLKMTMSQQKRAQELLLNFELTSQMRDVSHMTSEFLAGMSSLSKDMVKLTNEKEFQKVQKQFETAMNAAERQTMNIEMFMEESQSTFSSAAGTANPATDAELEKLILEQAGQDDFSSDQIDKELDQIRGKLKN